MTELSRSLLNAAREGLAPSADVAARVRAKVAAAVTVPAASAPAASTSAASTAPAAAPAVAPVSAAGSSSLLLKLGAALVVVGVVATVLVVIGSERAPEAPHVTVPANDGADMPDHVRVAAPNDPLVMPDEPPRRAKAAAPPALAVTTPTTTEASTSTTTRAFDNGEPASLSREVELIDRAMMSLRKNAPLAALEAMRVFERETLGRGQMAEEAAAIEIEARCVLREDVTEALARFDRKWPESAQRERIQTTCFARK